MREYKIKFWFEHGGVCLWGDNDKTEEKYGLVIEPQDLPISDYLKNQLEDLMDEYGTYLDWDAPQNPSPWSIEHKQDFVNRATEVYKKLKDELSEDFEIINEAHNSVYYC